LDARLIDIPAPAPTGLQGAPQQASQPVAAPPVAAPKPRIEKKPAAIPRVKKKHEAPPPMYDARGARTLPAEAVSAAGEQAAQSPPASGASGGGGVGALGTDNIGARALYAPPPQIPDDLREDVFETVAVAHFHVGFDGDTKVALLQPTSNPRLNVLLLDTLKQWRFFSAIRNGIAVDSDFDVRIPIAVQ
jgi:protein TonB